MGEGALAGSHPCPDHKHPSPGRFAGRVVVVFPCSLLGCIWLPATLARAGGRHGSRRVPITSSRCTWGKEVLIREYSVCVFWSFIRAERVRSVLQTPKCRTVLIRHCAATRPLDNDTARLVVLVSLLVDGFPWHLPGGIVTWVDCRGRRQEGTRAGVQRQGRPGQEMAGAEGQNDTGLAGWGVLQPGARPSPSCPPFASSPISRLALPGTAAPHHDSGGGPGRLLPFLEAMI